MVYGSFGRVLLGMVHRCLAFKACHGARVVQQLSPWQVSFHWHERVWTLIPTHSTWTSHPHLSASEEEKFERRAHDSLGDEHSCKFDVYPNLWLLRLRFALGARNSASVCQWQHQVSTIFVASASYVRHALRWRMGGWFSANLWNRPVLFSHAGASGSQTEHIGHQPLVRFVPRMTAGCMGWGLGRGTMETVW